MNKQQAITDIVHKISKTLAKMGCDRERLSLMTIATDASKKKHQVGCAIIIENFAAIRLGAFGDNNLAEMLAITVAACVGEQFGAPINVITDSMPSINALNGCGEDTSPMRQLAKMINPNFVDTVTHVRSHRMSRKSINKAWRQIRAREEAGAMITQEHEEQKSRLHAIDMNEIADSHAGLARRLRFGQISIERL